MALRNKNHHLLSLSRNSRLRKDDTAVLLRAKTNILKFFNPYPANVEKIVSS